MAAEGILTISIQRFRIHLLVQVKGNVLKTRSVLGATLGSLVDVQTKGVNNALVRDFVGLVAAGFIRQVGFARIDDLGSVHVAVSGNNCTTLNSSGIGNGNFAAGNASQCTRRKGNRHNGVVGIWCNSNGVSTLSKGYIAASIILAADFYTVLILNQLCFNRGIGNLEGFQAGDVFRDFDSQGIRHGIANTVIGFMCICGAVALGDGLCNIGLVVRNGQSGVGAVDGKTCVIHLTGNGIVNFHSLTILVNVKVEFAGGVQDIALVISVGITCFLQVVAAFGKFI